MYRLYLSKKRPNAPHFISPFSKQNNQQCTRDASHHINQIIVVPNQTAVHQIPTIITANNAINHFLLRSITA